ncbi:MAG: hypothetical protein AAF685_11660 [Cyanobacteria bacterium P01_C01_bin.89]
MLTVDEKIKLIESLLKRENRRDEAVACISTAYPKATPKMVGTAAFHAYADGVSAAVNWLVDLELFLRNNPSEFETGEAYHLIYHLYNLLHFEDLMSTLHEDLVDKVNDIQLLLEEDGDSEGAANFLDELKARLQG